MDSFDAALDDSIAYLNAAALDSLRADPYWPKWDSPWWHMMLLHEMGETARIPAAVLTGLVAALAAFPLQIFPIHPADLPAGIDPVRETLCHCQLGTVYRLLDACGVDVETEIPWIGTWFGTYQMADGGLNCDSAAYLVTDEAPPSSMVGTISAFEALVFRARPWTPAERAFVDRAAQFLIGRGLTRGSATRHNAAERDAAQHWPSLTFPRFYHYDVLRGLTALTAWAERTDAILPPESFQPVAALLDAQFPDGQIRIGRFAGAGHGTILRRPNGSWDETRHPASTFPLLAAVSVVGAVSPYLSQEWHATRQRLTRL